MLEWATDLVNPPPFIGVGQVVNVQCTNGNIVRHEVIGYDEETHIASLRPIESGSPGDNAIYRES